MDEADNILIVTANKLMEGEISEDDALDILDNNLETLGMLGLMISMMLWQSVYQMTDQVYKERI